MTHFVLFTSHNPKSCALCNRGRCSALTGFVSFWFLVLKWHGDTRWVWPKSFFSIRLKLHGYQCAYLSVVPCFSTRDRLSSETVRLTNIPQKDIQSCPWSLHTRTATGLPPFPCLAPPCLPLCDFQILKPKSGAELTFRWAACGSYTETTGTEGHFPFPSFLIFVLLVRLSLQSLLFRLPSGCACK